jgi:hypothetical protein
VNGGVLNCRSFRGDRNMGGQNLPKINAEPTKKKWRGSALLRGKSRSAVIEGAYIRTQAERRIKYYLRSHGYSFERGAKLRFARAPPRALTRILCYSIHNAIKSPLKTR